MTEEDVACDEGQSIVAGVVLYICLFSSDLGLVAGSTVLRWVSKAQTLRYREV